MRLPALEKNILVFRALQMALFLFYAEDLRRLLVNSVGSSVRQRHRNGAGLKGAKLLKAIFRKLEEEHLISHSESVEVQALLGHRDKIAHHIYLLTGDIEIPGRAYGFQRILKLKYDYKALKMLTNWHEEIDRRLDKSYSVGISPDSLLFEAAEHAYKSELSSLSKQIARQIRVRKTQK